MVAQEPTTPADSPWPDASYAWFVVVILALANAVSFVDRLILSLLVPEIKADLGLSDTEISLLQGFAFALFYAFMGLPIARLADSKNRKYIIGQMLKEAVLIPLLILQETDIKLINGLI